VLPPSDPPFLPKASPPTVRRYEVYLILRDPLRPEIEAWSAKVAIMRFRIERNRTLEV
jgi:hypothetical protein